MHKHKFRHKCTHSHSLAHMGLIHYDNILTVHCTQPTHTCINIQLVCYACTNIHKCTCAQTHKHTHTRTHIHTSTHTYDASASYTSAACISRVTLMSQP